MANDNTTKVASKGICSFCKGEFEKGKMTQHLKFCKERKAVIIAEETGKSRKPKKSKLFHILVEGRELPMYWMHLEMPASLSLLDLDGFLRDIWLECCGHLSEFKINKVSYSSHMEEDMFWGVPTPVVEAEPAKQEDKGDAGFAQQEGEDEDDKEALLTAVPPEIRTRVEELLRAEFPDENEEIAESEALVRLINVLATLLTPDSTLPITAEMRVNLVKTLNELQFQMLMALGIESTQSRIPEGRDIDVPLEEVLTVGQKFTHEYDFGSTTYLGLRVVAEREGVAHKGRNAIQVLTRNEPPVIACRECGKPAVVSQPGYYSGWDGALCQKCAAKDSEWGYEGMLPIVNSPRTGVCGYTG